MDCDLCDVESWLLVSVFATDPEEGVVYLALADCQVVVEVRIIIARSILLQKETMRLVRPRPAVLSKQSYLFIFKYLIIVYGVLADVTHLKIAPLVLSPLVLSSVFLPHDPWLHQ